MAATILVRGGGDLASGVILRLVRAGLNVVVTELEQPLAVRRLVAFCEAVYRGEITVEGVTARLAGDKTHGIGDTPGGPGACPYRPERRIPKNI